MKASAPVSVDKLQGDDGGEGKHHHHEQQHAPVVQDVFHGGGVLGQLVMLAAPLQEGVPIAMLLHIDQHVPQRGIAEDIQILEAHDHIPDRNHGLLVIAPDAAEAVHAPVGNGQELDLVGKAGEGEEATGKHQLKDQQEGHGGHGRGGVAHDAGDHQRHHIGGVGNEQNADAHVQQAPGRHHPGGRDPHAGYGADDQGHHRLRKAEQQLIDHLRQDIGGHVQAGAVLVLDDLPLPADHLDGVEKAIPDTGADQGEDTQLRALLVLEEGAAHHEDHDGGDQRAHGQQLPVVLVHEHAQEFAKINAGLGKAALVSDLLGHVAAPPSAAAARAA